MIINIHEEAAKKKEIWIKVQNYIVVIFRDKLILEKISLILHKSKTKLSVILSAIYYFKKVRRRYALYLKRLDNLVTCNVTKYLVGKKRQVALQATENDFNLFVISIIIACKHLLDTVYTNYCWAEVSGIPISNLNAYERTILDILDYRTHIPNQSFYNIVDEFEKITGNVTIDRTSPTKKTSTLKCVLSCITTKLTCINF
ncbi:hypothetical protein CWI38_0004p0090 [Hamiltosporidium tvaerminnensis]|uniref:Cyclin n=2 Tax=Hamiltosporidium TaxID=1176354 RepID=A0A4Q9M5F7_9MICR|nr:PHO85 cyclin-5 [Hamiltosporidium tvaerminnensis]TBU05345.1 hypothetical protein CWI37_0022p0040 [Hamiltosporidium tvaerminnensis]TBU08557.1 hypothetical protein CWI36_0123p0030 [Hamiltosporidium magnivora]TBU20966.1 hypothetical protein CWI38_0006p0040 [Hamiltosporidium tvaerminnensis]TBU21002.1 hypothetical protein CWI38_0004p0090 [Hamiltosporidium tvaerminnensis]